jgi:hypothetical protein
MLIISRIASSYWLLSDPGSPDGSGVALVVIMVEKGRPAKSPPKSRQKVSADADAIIAKTGIMSKALATRCLRAPECLYSLLQHAPSDRL